MLIYNFQFGVALLWNDSMKMAYSISAQASASRITKYWSKYKNNVDHDSPEGTTDPLLDDIISQSRWNF